MRGLGRGPSPIARRGPDGSAFPGALLVRYVEFPVQWALQRAVAPRS